jgi:FixJ family two-component response regulator
MVAIVDDDASVGRSTERLIRSFGYRARAFASGEEFLRSGTAAMVACLLLDVRMPGMDGLQVQRLLLEGGMNIPIVFITGRASDEEEHRARDAGAVAFLRKPVAQASLRSVLDRVLRQRARD